MNYSDITQLFGRVKENVGKVIIGKSDVMEIMFTALIAGGHVLLEDMPGTGKTVLARSLSKSLDCKFSRIQFTPDLLPSDITGISVYQPQSRDFSFHPGPVFTNVLLADEINRATPRTQSALLECMEERTVTEGGKTYALDQPFLVIATQNPVEIQGTFPLPEAQMDRFLVRLSMGYPTAEEAKAMMLRFLKDDPISALDAVATKEEIMECASLIKQCQVSAPVMDYISTLCESTRKDERVRLGASPRGMLALMHAGQALAAIRGRDYVTPDDIKTLAIPVLAHRVVMKGNFEGESDSISFIRELISSVPAPTEGEEAP